MTVAKTVGMALGLAGTFLWVLILVGTVDASASHPQMLLLMGLFNLQIHRTALGGGE